LSEYGFDLDKALELAGYKFEFEYGDYDYSWTITKVYTRDGRVFDLTDSGCSCNGYGDHWYDVDTAIGEMTEVTRAPSAADVGAKRYRYTHGADEETTAIRYRDLGLR
jgi:hypothetical protein